MRIYSIYRWFHKVFIWKPDLSQIQGFSHFITCNVLNYEIYQLEINDTWPDDYYLIYKRKANKIYNLTSRYGVIQKYLFTMLNFKTIKNLRFLTYGIIDDNCVILKKKKMSNGVYLQDVGNITISQNYTSIKKRNWTE